MEYADESVARQKVLLDLINGTSKYDLVMLGTDGAVQAYSYAGYLEPLDGYLDSATEYFNADDIYPQFLEANTVNGQLWALPYYSFGGGVIYRKDIFEKYGLSEFPKTTEGVEEALAIIKAGLEKDGITDVYPLTMRGASGEEPTLDLSGFVYAYAGYPAWFEGGATTPDEIKATKAQPLFNTDFKPGFETFVRWSQEYGPPGIASHTWVDMMNIYGQGKAVVLLPSAINGFAALGGTEDENVRDHSAYAPSPIGPGGKPIQSFWTFSVGVSKFSNNKDEAYKTLAFMTGRQSMELLLHRSVGRTTPTRTSLGALYWLKNGQKSYCNRSRIPMQNLIRTTSHIYLNSMNTWNVLEPVPRKRFLVVKLLTKYWMI